MHGNWKQIHEREAEHYSIYECFYHPHVPKTGDDLQATRRGVIAGRSAYAFTDDYLGA
jgi:hypothetical protein